MLDSATRVFIDGGSVGVGLYKQKSNEANVNIIRDDVAAFVINVEYGIAGALVPNRLRWFRPGRWAEAHPTTGMCRV
ncbi:hypothetical protein PS273GM_19370 [Stutzerimonas stutzeri]|uniref:Uncharacterized protein n=1 Tax=Stutzerimonas stutzeri TaxID=316 RepID=A0A172WV63_STUST|nr:hypothetical protein PS273GM_19370 [Stutzerimonas stutzeri]